MLKSAVLPQLGLPTRAIRGLGALAAASIEFTAAAAAPDIRGYRRPRRVAGQRCLFQCARRLAPARAVRGPRCAPPRRPEIPPHPNPPPPPPGPSNPPPPP